MEIKVGKDCLSLLYITAVKRPVHALLESHLQSYLVPNRTPSHSCRVYSIPDLLPRDNVSLIEQKIHSDRMTSTNLTFCTPDHTGSRHQQPCSRAMVLISWMVGNSEVIRCSCRAVFLSGQTLNPILYMIHSLLLCKQPRAISYTAVAPSTHLDSSWTLLTGTEKGSNELCTVQHSHILFQCHVTNFQRLSEAKQLQQS